MIWLEVRDSVHVINHMTWLRGLTGHMTWPEARSNICDWSHDLVSSQEQCLCDRSHDLTRNQEKWCKQEKTMEKTSLCTLYRDNKVVDMRLLRLFYH